MGHVLRRHPRASRDALDKPAVLLAFLSERLCSGVVRVLDLSCLNGPNFCLTLSVRLWVNAQVSCSQQLSANNAASPAGFFL